MSWFGIDERWWIPAILLLAVGVLLTLLGYRRSPGMAAGRRWLAAGLKLMAFTLLAVALLNPGWVTKKPSPGTNEFVILVDNSASMSLPGDRESSRAEIVQELFLPENRAWLDQLQETFQVRLLTFDEAARPASDLSAATPTGRETALQTTLDQTGELFADRPLAGLLLISDGASTDGFPTTPVPAPVHVLPLGSSPAPADLRLGKPDVVLSPFENAQVRIDLPVDARNLAGIPIEIELFDEGGQSLAKKNWTPDEPDASTTVRFELPPWAAGSHGGSVVAKLEQGEEFTTRNNRRHFVINRRSEPYRILYVSGRPNWEHKFLQRALETDSQLRMVSLIRLARREPKFSFRRRAGEASNPLFRGADTDETAARFDEPVLVRLNTRDAEELRAGFPKLEPELFQYDAVILDDLEAEFFAPAQLQLLDRYVRERGGGLLLLGGAESFSEGGYDQTPVAGLAPVYLEETVDGTSRPIGPAPITLTREGWLQPWLRLETDRNREERRLAALAPLEVLNLIGRLRPGALTYLSLVTGDPTDPPLLAAHQVGRGRVMLVAAGDLWRTGMTNQARSKELARWWRQVIRWLVVDVPQSLELTIEQTGETPVAQLTAVDPRFRPDSRARVEADQVQPGAHPPRALPLQPSSEVTGQFDAALSDGADGPQYIRARLRQSEEETYQTEQGWVIDREVVEFFEAAGNPAALRRLAETSGGSTVSIANLSDWAESLSTIKAPVMKTEKSPLWHNAWYFLAALACLVGEWGLRRQARLP